jgi:2-polyprenyl-6-methoxyphenol hydroxylase-like FAD-dependent oxidoreductase
MNNTKILISGASIAGPALAFWLQKQGASVTVVERAPALREGGQAVDFRGPVHMDVLQRMGIVEALRREQTNMRELFMLDAAGKRVVTLPSSFTSGALEIQRGDLSRILHAATRDRVEYIFDDTITSMSEHAGGVDVRFARTADRTFDLVIGADGLHSGVRALAFGHESQFMRFHGYYVAGFDAPNRLQLDHQSVIYSVPGRAAMVAAARDREQVRALLVFASVPLDAIRRDVAAQRRTVADVFAGVGWEVPSLLAAMWRSPDLYFDSISHVVLPHYSIGRVGLLGDAAYGGTLGGQGTGLAIVCAYVLAAELAATSGAHQLAFSRYESRVRSYAETCQKGATRVGGFLAPKTASGIWLRNQTYRALASRPLAGFLEKLVNSSASAFDLGLG